MIFTLLLLLRGRDTGAQVVVDSDVIDLTVTINRTYSEVSGINRTATMGVQINQTAEFVEQR